LKNLVKQVFNTECRLTNTTGSNNSNTYKCDEHQTDQWLYWFMITFNLIGFSITIVCVSFAIFIFLSIRCVLFFVIFKLSYVYILKLSRSLRCLRNMIHCNMLFTFVLKCATYICFHIFLSNKMSSIWEKDYVIL
jgi:hypothetical protein